MTDRCPPLHILAFEPFDAGSHRAVRQSISRHSRHHWTWLTRPGRAWKWRMRISAIELVDQARAEGAFDRRIDAIFATSLLSAADLRAVLPRGLRDLPLLLYMHENQAAYPAGTRPSLPSVEWDAHYALTNLASVLAADAVLWNSRWNLRSFIEGIQSLLRKAPDCQLADVSERIEAVSEVVWPPVEHPPSPGPRVLHNAARVVWPHRWEHDKGPGELLDLADRFSEPLNLRWTVLGQEFDDVPPALEEFRRRHAGRIDHMGFVPGRAGYWDHLRRCDWVLSTARHEFFGIAVVEAMLAGCLPWLPDRLSYPELLPDAARGLTPGNPPGNAQRVRDAIRSHLEPVLAPHAVGRLDAALERQV